jgi:signal transduction histidine kinase
MDSEDLIKEKLKACRKLSLHAAHKIRNPLSALLNVLFQLKKRAPADDTGRELLVILEEEIYHLKILSDELALFARDLPEEKSDTYLGVFLKGVKDRCIRDCVLFSDKMMEIDPPTKDLHAEFDVEHAGAVLEAVIFHALVKTDERPKVRLSAAVKNGRVVFTASFDGTCHLSVQRGGLMRIVNSSEEKVVADLSMALIEHLVEQRGGSVEVSTTDTVSTTITLTL